MGIDPIKPTPAVRRWPSMVSHTDNAEQWIHGRRVAYRDTGGDGPTVMLVHGITNSARSWEPVTQRLGDIYRVLAPDLPGHGDSDRH